LVLSESERLVPKSMCNQFRKRSAKSQAIKPKKSRTLQGATSNKTAL
jgi:hypothetical protein